MAQLVQYIKELSNQSFEFIKNHFQELDCRIYDNDDSYMITISHDYQLKNEVLRNAIGTIIKKDTNELMCVGFPFTEDLNMDTFDMKNEF